MLLNKAERKSLMTYSTTNTYKMKREILNFARIISSGLYRPEQKFFGDILYGMLASGSCLLTDIAQRLNEDTRKSNTVERLSRHLTRGIPQKAMAAYLRTIRKWLPQKPVIHIDDSDVVKPEGKHFESLGWVRDGSASTKDKCVIQKGYHVTEACALTTSGHPVSIFSRIHSSEEKNFTSINNITFAAMERGVKLCGKATFVMDRGYDDNKMFLKLDDLGQEYVIRLTKKRKLYHHNRWVSAAELCARRKGKVKMKLFYRGAEHTAYLSHVKVQITASKKEVYLVLVYGITENPMMLVTNRPICSKEDVLETARLYFSRWRIEEYFRSKKDVFDFENFRVRKLTAINALNFFIGVCMAFLGLITMKKPTNKLRCAVYEAADPIRKRVRFHYYRVASGIRELLRHAKTGIRDWFKPKRTNQNQLRFSLTA